MTRNPNKVVLLFAGILSAYAVGFWLYSPSQPVLTFAATDAVPAPTPRTPEPTDAPPAEGETDLLDAPAIAPASDLLVIAGPGEKRVVPPEFTTYTLVAGDTSFAAISRRVYGTARHADAISRANAFTSPHRLRVGQTIRIPKDPTNISGKIEIVPTVIEVPPPTGNPQLALPTAPIAASNPPPAQDAPPTSVPDRIHTVQRGETLSDISLRYYGSAGRWRRILDANTDVLTRPERIKPGMKLVIPD
ncbi:MAG: LysM peptidoglycan-binding domain-containing protein [Phycisphaerales bacterium]|jgi:nucleoid-associated protein YgaU|nr:LysM peptidoglycan-binding domain-containing protein [Phycisphaerales bacterium]